VIGADECNQIIRTLSYKSFEGKYKVMIIWMAERLYHSAAPKILKILEEPPDQTLFILVAEKQEQIISTILSRTQIVKVPSLDNEAMTRILSLKFGYPMENIDSILPSAAGNVNHAIGMLEESMSGEFSSGEFREWMLMCYAGKYKELYDFVSKTARNPRTRQKQLLTCGLGLSRSCLLHTYGRPELLNIADPEEREFISKISRFLNHHNALQYVALFEEALLHIERNGNAALVFMDLSVRAGKLLKPAR